MKLKSNLAVLAVAGVVLVASAPAHALIALDSWQLNLNGAGIGSNTTNIGHLTLAGGEATVLQEVNGAGDVFVGAKFSESGNIFNLTYVANSKVGTGDSGASLLLNNFGVIPGGQLQMVFTSLTGVVTGVNSTTGAFTYAFDPTVGTIQLKTADSTINLADFTAFSPSNGSFGNNLGAAGAVGDSTLLAKVLSTGYTAGLFADSTGTALDPDDLFFNVVTHNTIAAGDVSGPGACGFATAIKGNGCLTVRVTSDGPADLFKVPEPASLALVGLGLLGAGVVRRRKAKAD